jgi:hypothetical protein
MLLALTALALALAIGSSGHATPESPAGTQPEMFGMSVNRVFNDDFTPAHWDAPLAAVHATGFRAARSDAFWMWAEPDPPAGGKHTYQWAKLDAEAGALAKHGLRWLPILDYSAPWAETVPGNYHSPPTSNDDYAAYAKAFAERYGRGGSYWSEHPSPEGAPVTTYEIWNEPNGPWFWHPTPDPAAYADMYLKAREAIKAVDPNATVVVGGLVADATFVERMYAARPDLRGNVDAIGWHAYGPTVNDLARGVRGLRQALVRLGDPDVPIHLTELGWPTHGTDPKAKPIVVSEDARAALLEVAAEAFARSDCNVAAVIPYTWTTPEKDVNNEEDWYGIRHPDGSATPSSDAMARVLERWRTDPPSSDVNTRFRLCHPADADRDGIPNAEDTDDDNDGVPDTADAFPLDPRETSDLDHDGLGDNADADDDGDGTPDVVDAFPADPREHADADLDGIGDNADPDDDNDGLSDTTERRLGTSTTDADSDDDGLADGAETRTSPIRADSDGDGLPDGLEVGVTVPVSDPPGIAAGTDLRRFRPDRNPRTRTRPLRRDSDGDGLPDGAEDRNHDGRRNRGETDPLSRDSDGDHVPDGVDRRPLDPRRQ